MSPLRHWRRMVVLAALDRAVRRTMPSDPSLETKHARCRRERVDPMRAAFRVAKFRASAPDWLWVADPTYVKTHSGWVYVAFIIDVYSRMVVGWQASRSLRSDQVAASLEAVARHELFLGPHDDHGPGPRRS
jgi:transposase InsO family protein